MIRVQGLLPQTNMDAYIGSFSRVSGIETLGYRDLGSGDVGFEKSRAGLNPRP